jgi:hypothetical protein
MMRINIFTVLILSILLGAAACGPTTKSSLPVYAPVISSENSPLLEQLMHQAGLTGLMDQASEYRLQVIFSQIERDKAGKPLFAHHSYRNGAEYFYPASTVKLPAAVLALEYINDLKNKDLSMHTAMLTLPVRPGEEALLTDKTSRTGLPSVAHYIKKILLVSNNDAFNRLYELTGQEWLNRRLNELGFKDAQIIHRLEISLTEAENRQTNAVRFVDDTGRVVHEQGIRISQLPYAERRDFIGSGYIRNGQLVKEPMNFNQKNRWSLQDHHTLVQWIMFPESQPAGKKLRLTEEDYRFLCKYMGMLPQESDYPNYQLPEYWPSYVKFLLYGSEKEAVIPPNIRIYNKVGDAYGFLIDAAYINDAATGVEFLLSAVIYCNEDGILNDNKYDYDAVGFPFMKRLGEAVYNYELSRKQ